MTVREKFIEDCYQQYYELLLNICRKKVNNNPIYSDLINSCIQDTFVLAYQLYDDIAEYANIRAWLIRTCMNRLIPYASLLRNRVEREAFSFDDSDRLRMCELYVYDVNEESEREDACASIVAVIQELSKREEIIFRAYFLEGLLLTDIARQQKCSIGTIKATIYRIRKKAKKVQKSFK